jgi:oxygen-independent coproporphyrinogen-3 oxidase
MSNLIKRAEKIYKSLPIQKARKAGFRTDPRNDEYTVANHPFILQKPFAESDVQLNDLKINKDFDLYIHIPFCDYHCAFCTRYLVSIKQNDAKKEEYVDHLIKEIQLFKKRLGSNAQIRSIYFGGGTPTALPQNLLFKIIRYCSENLPLCPDVEITLETNPGRLQDPDILQEAINQGFNRVSIGVQTLDNKILKYCERKHTAKEALNAIANCQNAGFKKINVDLMTGLPLQTLVSWENTLKKIIIAKPTCVTVYRMYLTPASKLYWKTDKEMRLPSEKERLLMDIMAIEFFKERGVLQGPLRYFQLKKETVSKHQDDKFTGKDLVGLGVSAYSYINNIVTTNYYRYPLYYQTIERNKPPIGAAYRLNEEELMSRSIIHQIKWNGEIDPVKFKSKFGKTPQEIYPQKIKTLLKLSLIEKVDGKLRLTYLGRMIAESIGREFFSPKVIKNMMKLKKIKMGSYDTLSAIQCLGL